MYPTIYHALYDLLGIDWSWTKLLNSFGFFVALAFVVASYTLGRELKRRSTEGLFQPEIRKVIIGKGPQWPDVFINALIGYFVGWKFIYLLINSNALFGSGSPQQHIFSSEGYWWMGVIMALVFGAWRWWEYKRQQLPTPKEEEVRIYPHDLTGTITFLSAIFGILGAKLFHLLENPKEFVEFFTRPSLNSFLSGLTVYGGLIVGAAGVLIYAYRRKINLLHLCDSAAPGMILSYGIGRIGCHVSGDGDWGINNLAPKPGWLSWAPDWFWAYDYPNNVNSEGVPLFPCDPHFEGYCTHLVPSVFPTPVYETIIATLIFVLLWSIRKRLKLPGTMMALYMIFNGLERFLIEKIRVNVRMKFLGMEMTQAELISVLFIITGIVMLILINRRKSKTSQLSTAG
jgi:phosphatidylglycerol---prolipoprotein diacylglyceryl transferase